MQRVEITVNLFSVAGNEFRHLTPKMKQDKKTPAAANTAPANTPETNPAPVAPNLTTEAGRAAFAAANPTTAVVPAAPTSLFATDDAELTRELGIDLSKAERRNKPQLLKPDTIPVGQSVIAEILDACNSPNTSIKGKCLWLRHKSGAEMLLPVTGVIRQALVPGVKNDESDKLLAELKKDIGKILVVKRLPDTYTRKYAASNEPPKVQFMFDVWTAVKPTPAPAAETAAPGLTPKQ